MDVDVTTHHAGIRSVRASTKTVAPNGPESRRTASALLQKLDEERRNRWNEAVQSIDFTHSSLENGALLTTLLATQTPTSPMSYFCRCHHFPAEKKWEVHDEGLRHN